MNRRNFAFDRTNFLLLAIGFAIVVIGFILMSGGGAEDNGFSQEIFSARRIKVAPAVCFIGFVSMIYAVLRRPKALAEDDAETPVSQEAEEENAQETAKETIRTTFKH